MNELIAAEIQPGMRDFSRVGPEEQQISRLETILIYGNCSVPASLISGVARHPHSPLTQQHLRESRTVEAE
jgi:hypothetical protein